MRLLILAAATILATGIGAAPASAQGYHGRPGYHGGHRHRVCRVVWRHHHRVRQCWWR